MTDSSAEPHAGATPPEPARQASGWLADLRADPILNVTVLLLLAISGYATWRGLNDFVAVQDETAGLAADLGFAGLIAAIVIALTLAMYVALREMLKARNWKRVIPGVLAFGLYALLAMWSVGFGYGFWWSLVAGEKTSANELHAAITRIEDETARLTAAIGTAEMLMRDAATLSAAKADQEARLGASCGVSSGTGEGPLYRARMETNAQVATLADSIENQWSASVRTEVAALRSELTQALSTGGTDQKTAMEQAWTTARSSAGRISAEATARGSAYAAQLRAKADQLDDAPVGGSVAYCYDPDLARALSIAADAIASPVAIELDDWSWSGGKAGVARAIEGLWAAPLSVVGVKLRSSPLDGRSLVALIAAIAVDFALFVFTVFQAVAAGERRGHVTRLNRAEAKELTAARRSLTDAKGELDRLQADLLSQTNRYNAAQEQVGKLDQELGKASRRLAELESRPNFDRVDLAAFMHEIADRIAALFGDESDVNPEDRSRPLVSEIRRYADKLDS